MVALAVQQPTNRSQNSTDKIPLSHATPDANWTDKSQRQKDTSGQAFTPNEVIRAQGYITVNDGKLVFHIDSDNRVADDFFIGKASEHPELLDVRGMNLTADLKITKFNGTIVSNAQSYDAEFIGLAAKPVINPTYDEIKKIGAGQSFVVEGTFLEIDKNASGSGSIVRIESKNGDIYSVPLFDDKLRLTSGTLENVDGKEVRKGDQIRLPAYKTKAGEITGGWASTCFLAAPSAERQTEFNALTKEVFQKMQVLDRLLTSGRFKEARATFADIRKMELSQGELNETEKMLPRFPEKERPVAISSKDYVHSKTPNYEINALDESYGVKIESMTKSEFIEFAKKVGSGELSQSGKHSDASYVYRLFDDFKIDTSTSETILTYSLDQRLDVSRNNPAAKFDDTYMVDQTISALCSLKTKSSTEKLVKLLADMIDKKEYLPSDYFDQRDKGKKFPEYHVDQLISSLSYLSYRKESAELLKSYKEIFQKAIAALSNSFEKNSANELAKTLERIN